MKIKDMFCYIKSKFFRKKNIFFIIILSFIILISFFSLTLLQFVIGYKNDMINKNMQVRTLIVYAEEEEDYDKIDELEHIIFNGSSKYLNGHYSLVNELSTDNKASNVLFLPYIDDYDMGDLENGQVICPKEFYPFYLYSVDEKDDLKASIDYNKILDGDELIGKKITIISDNEEFDDLQVQIVRTYDASSKLNPLNVCYMTIEDYDKVISPYQMVGTGTDIHGNTITDYYEYEGNMVVVDNYKNVDGVINELRNNGFDVVKNFEFDETMINYYFWIPIFLCLIILIVCLNLFYSFIKKKIKERLVNYGILKTSGYVNHEVYKLEMLENVLLVMISFVLAFFLYYVVYTFIIKIYFFEVIYYNIKINIPYFLMIIELVILFIILAIIIGYCLHQVFKKNILELVRSE